MKATDKKRIDLQADLSDYAGDIRHAQYIAAINERHDPKLEARYQDYRDQVLLLDGITEAVQDLYFEFEFGLFDGWADTYADLRASLAQF